MPGTAVTVLLVWTPDDVLAGELLLVAVRVVGGSAVMVLVVPWDGAAGVVPVVVVRPGCVVEVAVPVLAG